MLQISRCLRLAQLAAAALAVGSLGATQEPKASVAAPVTQTVSLHPIDHVLGVNVHTEDDKEVGEIHDLVIDSSDGSIEYVVIAQGGVLGVGENKHLIPWERLHASAKDKAKPHDLQARVSLSEDQIKSAPLCKEDQPFDADLERQVRQAAGVPAGEARSPSAALICARDLKGAKVKGSGDEEIGEIDEVIVDIEQGSIAYTVLGAGGTLGLGEKNFPLPWQLTQASYDQDNKFVMRSTLTKDRLMQAPLYEEKDSERMFSSGWVVEVYKFYSVEPYWARTRPASATKSPEKRTGGAEEKQDR